MNRWILLIAFSFGLPAFGENPTPAELKKRYAERTTAMHEAAEKGQVSLMFELLKSGADVNDKDEQGKTALHKAAEKGNRSATIALLMFGADVGEKDAKGLNPIHAAAANGHHETLTLFCSPYLLNQVAGDIIKGGAAEALKGAGFNLKGATDKLTALSSSSLSATDSLGQTPIMKAAAGGHTECVKTIGLYSDRRSQDKQGRTTLMIAAAAGHADLIRAMWPENSIPLEYLLLADKEGKTAESIAKAANHADTAKLLAEMEQGATALAHRNKLTNAARENDTAAVKALLEKTKPGEVPGAEMMIAASFNGATQSVQLLLEMWKDKPIEEKVRLMGFPLEYRRPQSAFHLASKAGHLEVLKAITDTEWWKDKVTLADVLKRKDNGSDTYRIPSELAANSVITAFFSKKLAELEAKK